MAKPAEPEGEVEPEYDLVHRGNRDFQEAWKDGRVSQGSSVAALRPKALVLRVKLPKLSSAAGVDLDVTPHMVYKPTPEVCFKYLCWPNPICFCVCPAGFFA